MKQKIAEIKKDILYFKSLPSTNDYVRRYLGKSLPEGTVVVADQQIRGRGRGDNKWVSLPGVGLYFSFYFKPSIAPHLMGMLSLAISVAVANALSTLTNVNFSLKWPNDVMLLGKKVGGILLESCTNADNIEHVIVGVGLNLNHRPEQLPDENAGSVYSLTGLQLNKTIVLNRLIASLNGLIQTIRTQSNWTGIVRKNWLQLCGHRNKTIRMIGQVAEFAGEFVDISEFGEALIKDDNKNVVPVSMAQFSLREK